MDRAVETFPTSCSKPLGNCREYREFKAIRATKGAKVSKAIKATKEIKATKDFRDSKAIKGIREPKESKALKETKALREPKANKALKVIREPKATKDSKVIKVTLDRKGRTPERRGTKAIKAIKAQPLFPLCRGLRAHTIFTQTVLAGILGFQYK